ncbi:MAG: M23 family metallopeptidase [Treponema sp.]|nr:M23 family metallopeptidase [Treponema sp.]
MSIGSKAAHAQSAGKKLLVLLTLEFAGSLLPGLVYGIDWPAQAVTVSANFGVNDQGNPTMGVSFASEGSVGAADTGELIFSYYSTNTASRLPSPLGAWIALDHGEGLISIYSRLEDTQVQDLPQTLEQGMALGIAGRSGWSEQRGFHFSLFDRKERCWVNPSMIITPLPDTRPPTIQSVTLRNEEGRIIEPNQSIPQGRYRICVTVADTRIGPNESPLAPHRILCTVNGSEIGALTFETYSARDGVLMVYRNGLVPVKQVYAPAPGFEVGEVWVTRGQVSLEIIAQDITGNSQSAVYRLPVE